LRIVGIEQALREIKISDLLNDPKKAEEFCKKHNLDPTFLNDFLIHQLNAREKKTGDIMQESFENERKQYKTKDEDEADSETEDPNEKESKLIWYLGLLFMACLAVYEYKKHYQEALKTLPTDAFTYSDKTIAWMKLLPTRYFSSLWGHFTNIEYSPPVKNFIINTYSKIFHCNLEEAEFPISEYKSLADFFKRNLKEGVRPIMDPENVQLISPVDGRVVHYGIVGDDDASIQQVKGVDFKLADFMGEDSPIFDVIKQLTETERGKEKDIYYCVIYLAPGDYHGYHSPADWTIQHRTHFPGYLFPVADWATHKIRNLFAMNERVVLTGEWKHGFFAYVPVGAYNVGSMKFDFDDIITNKRKQRLKSPPELKEYDPPVEKKIGENIGFFNLGSSVVMIFESPPVFFMVPRGGKVKLGETLTKEVTPEMAQIQLDKLLNQLHEES